MSELGPEELLNLLSDTAMACAAGGIEITVKELEKEGRKYFAYVLADVELRDGTLHPVLE